MANGQIDVIVAKKAIDELNLALKGVDAINNSIITLSKNVRELNTNFANVKTPKDLESRLKKNAEGQKLIKKEVDKVIEAETKLRITREKGFEKFERDLDRQRRARLKDTDSIRNNKLALDRQRQAALKVSGAYAKLNKQYTESKNRLANLLAAEKRNNTEVRRAQIEFEKLGARIRSVDAATRNYTKNVGNYSSAFKGALGFTKQMVSALGLMGGAFLAVQVIRDVVKTIKEFNQETAVLASVLQKSREQIEPLTKNAKELGAVTAKTANEVVKLQVAYARLGFTQQEILDLTESTIEGSIAMNAELDTTAELVGAVVNSMDALSTTDAPEIMDIMALSTAKSALNFEKLQTGLPIVLGAANALNVPFTKVVATLGKLADAGIETSTAATSLRNIFIESAKKGIDYESALNQVRNSTDKLKTANEIFGKRAAVSALVIANNTENVKELDKALQDAGGTAEKMAKQQLDTLVGSITLLSSAWDGFILGMEDGEGVVSGAAKSIIESITGILTTYTKLQNIVSSLGSDDSSFFNRFKSLIGLGENSTNFFKNLGRSVDLADKALKSIEDRKALVNETVLLMQEANDKELTRHEVLKIGAQLTKLSNKQLKELNSSLKNSTTDINDQKSSIINSLLAFDDKLKRYSLEKKSLKELTELLKKYQKTDRKVLKGSIESLQEIIKANNAIIKQTNNDSVRRKLKQENQLLQKQIELLNAVPKAVKAINTISGGVVTLEEAKRRSTSGQRAGTAQAGGTATESIPGLKDLEGQDPTLFDVDVNTASAFETAVNDVKSFVDTYGAQLQQAEDITNAFFDNRIERIQQDIDKNNEFFANQIALAEGNEAEQVRLEQERQIKDAQLKKKKQKEVEKQAIFNKAIAVATIGLNTAVAIISALAPPPIGLGPVAGIPLATTIGTLGAIQAGVALATPIPKFKDGTNDAPSGLAIVGDGGKHEYIEDSKGNIVKTPNTDTLVNLGKGGQKIHKDLESLQMDKRYDLEAINNAAVMSSIYNDGLKLSALEIANVFSDTLDKYQGQIQKEIKQGLKGFKSNVNVNVNTEHLGYMNDTL